MNKRVKTGLAWLRWEAAGLLGPAVTAVRRRQWSRFWLGPAAMLLVAALSIAFRTRAGHAFLQEYAITRPGESWSTALRKLPLSMFAPAALLPFWFAMLQVLVVYGLANALLGWRRTVAVALLGHTLATFSAHLWIEIGRPLGVGHRYDHFGDAGPSVAVVALIAYVAVARRASWLAAALIGYHTVEIGIFNALSQREHLLGALTGAVAAAIVRTRSDSADHGTPGQIGPKVVRIPVGSGASPARTPVAGVSSPG